MSSDAGDFFYILSPPPLTRVRAREATWFAFGAWWQEGFLDFGTPLRTIEYLILTRG